MKVYLAAPCSTEYRTELVKVVRILRAHGFEVYAPFELQIPNAWDMSQERWAKIVFDKDVEAINAADAVLVVSQGRESTAGTNWEQGYAYAKGKTIYVYQMNQNPTSLMTYWGSSGFRSWCNFSDVADKMIGDLNGTKCKEIHCMTVLT